MAKRILVGGHEIPIAIETPVVTYQDNPDWSFYNWLNIAQGFKTPEEFALLSQMRPKGRLWSKRRGLDAEPTMGQVPVTELQALGEKVHQVVLHFDSTLTSKVCFRVLISRGLSTHFCLNWDGALYQVLDVYEQSWASGANNPYCIAIDLNNPAEVGRASTDVAKPPRQIFSGRINGSKKVGLGYTDAQYATLIALFRALKDAKIPGDAEGRLLFPKLSNSFFPPYDAEGEVVTRLLTGKGVDFHGFIGHWHCSARKWDPGPGFDWERVVAGIHGEKNSFPVVLPGQSNLNDLMGSLNSATEAYYENVEYGSGGWYPIGAGQSWHSGVHLHLKQGEPVLAMLKGEIVAVRNAKKTDLGNPGFVLIRHDMVDDPEAKEPIKPYFSLYMHLARLDDVDEISQMVWAEPLLDGSYEPPKVDDLFGSTQKGRPYHEQRPYTMEAADGNFRKNDYKNFWDGDIILTSIPVSPGDVIGLVGQFGTNEWTMEDMVHVEILAPHNPEDKGDEEKGIPPTFGNVITDTGTDWIVVEAEVENTNLISIDKILEPIVDAVGVRRKSGLERVVKTSDIQEFFADPSNEGVKSDFRKMITLHVSEWSTNIDWRKTAAPAVGWSWQTQEAFTTFLSEWFPFMWMNPEVSEWAGFPESHRFYYYHPIYFLSFLAKNYSPSSKDAADEASNKELEDEAEKEKREAEERKARITELTRKQGAGEMTPEEEAELFRLISEQDRHDGDADIGQDDVLYEVLPEFTRWEPGEWEPPKY